MSKLPTEQELELIELTSVFAETRNPAAAWLTYHLARKHNLPVPEIVANEIDRFAAEVSKPLLAAWNGDLRAKITTKNITAAWGCARGIDRTEALRISRRDARIAADYWTKLHPWQRERKGLRPTDAIEELSKEYSLGVKKIEEILTAARKVFGPDDPSPI